MPSEHISYRDTGYFSSLICDYLDKKQQLTPFYHRFPSLDNFEAQLEEKKTSFSKETRNVLSNVLKTQYASLSPSELVVSNIESLNESETFTITTGHQLNLFTGPLYFLYKIIHTITLSRKLNLQHPNQHFVPVYWMATEDHDFDEINYFRYKGKKVQWNRKASGAVGELDTSGLLEVLTLFKTELGTSKNARFLATLFEEAYLKHDTLAAATRYLANELFGEYGLVIVDGNDADLKREFIPFVKRELEEQIAHKKVTEQTNYLVSTGYKEQVHPREINLFYIKKGVRERIIQEGDSYRVNDTEMLFTKENILAELEEHPERFSPNALLRPLFQEVILPNLCYIGGGGELAYWFQLKSYFEEVEIPFPILMLRNSALLRTRKQAQKAENLGVNTQQLFNKQETLINQQIRRISHITIDFSEQRTFLKKQFESMYSIAKETDVSFIGAVKAQEVKQLKGLDNLESRLLRAQKYKLKEEVQRLVRLQDASFPLQSLQERNTNFAEFYLEYGETLIPIILESLRPENHEFTVITI